MIVLNEYNKATGFYKLYGIEADIRNIAKECPNSYQIALFACCREIKTQKHGGGFRTKSEASVAHMKKQIVRALIHKLKNAEEKLIIENYLKLESLKNQQLAELEKEALGKAYSFTLSLFLYLTS